MADVDLKNVSFNPSQTVVFEPTKTRQKIVFEITNNEKVDVVVKWKSTRPGVYHMIPTYSKIPPGETTTTDLICKGMTRNECSGSSRDRFSIVLAPISQNNLDARTVWKDFECQKKLFIGKIIKKTVYILYAGVNDTVDFSITVPGEPIRSEGPDLTVIKRESGENMLERCEEDCSEDMKTTRTAGIFTQILIPIGNSILTDSSTINTSKPNLAEDI